MAGQDNINRQDFKTIREMQEEMQESLQNEKIEIQKQVEEIRKISNGEADKEARKTQQDFPSITNAKTIKESMADWIDDAGTSVVDETRALDGLTPNSSLKGNIALSNSKNANITTNQHISQKLQDDALKDITNGVNIEQHIQSSPMIQKSLEQQVVAKQTKAMETNMAESKQERYQQIVVNNAKAKQETWILLDEFLRLSGLEKEKVQELINDKSIKSKQENGSIYVEASTGTSALIKKVENRLVSLDMNGNALDPVFVEKTIATILGLHDKVLSAKDETISAFKSENSFLKEALVSMQEIYDDDKKTIEILRQQLQKTQEEVEFVKRKYKLMWGKVSNSTT